MMNLAKHLNNNLLLLLFVVVFFVGCSKEEKKSNIVVKVKDAVLTEDDLREALGEFSNRAKFREQFINEWIEREVLFQKAIEEGITMEKEYNSILERSKRELASALLINKILSENSEAPTIDELQNYYESSKEDFRLMDDAYRINVIRFSNFDDAVRFRSILIESDWNKALNAFRGVPSIVNIENNQLYYGYQLQPPSFMRVVSNLLPNEVSIVLPQGDGFPETEPMKFTIVQLIEKLNKGDIPPFEAVKEKVKERYQVLKNKNYIREYIDNLIVDYDIEIKRYSE